MAEEVKLPLVMPISPIRVLVQVPAALLPIQLPTNAPREAADDGPSVWAPATYVGYLDGVPGSWLQPAPALAVVDIWEVNLWMEDLCCCPYFHPLEKQSNNQTF